MIKKILQSHKVLRFCRWSRKAYGAFISLHREVTIGHVCKSIADAAISKLAGIQLVSTSMTTSLVKDNSSSGGDEGGSKGDAPPQSYFQNNLLFLLIFCFLGNAVNCHHPEFYCLLTNKNYKSVLFRLVNYTGAGRFVYIFY